MVDLMSVILSVLQRMGAGQVLPKKLDGGPSHELSICAAGATTKQEAAKLERLIQATQGFVTREAVSEQLFKRMTAPGQCSLI